MPVWSSGECAGDQHLFADTAGLENEVDAHLFLDADGDAAPRPFLEPLEARRRSDTRRCGSA